MKKAAKRSNGDGTVYFLEKENKWRAEISWKDAIGKTHRKSWQDKRQSEVKAKLSDFKKQLLLSGGNLDPQTATFREFADFWVEQILKPKVKPLSYQRKVSTLEHQVYPYLGGLSVGQITHISVQSMVNALSDSGLSYSTVKKAFEAVNGCLRYYRIKTATAYNPCEGVSLPENKRNDVSDIKFFSEEQRKKVFREATRTHANGACVYRLGWAFVLLMYSGMRVGELCALTWDDINFADKTISICKGAIEYTERDKDGIRHSTLLTQDSTKTKSGNRVIPMTNRAYEALTELQKITGGEEYIITSAKHKRIRPSRLDTTFHKILTAGKVVEEGETLGVHSLRHTFASMLFNNGCEVKIVSELLGHSNTKITENIYIHLIQENKAKAISMIDKYSD